jgi:hypothetical protein
VGWDREEDPPAPIIGGDAIYPIPMNALMARHYGLSWVVTTDHGGPNHSKVHLEKAYPELLQSRAVVPGLIQFFGMEFDSPGVTGPVADRSTDTNPTARVVARFGEDEWMSDGPYREISFRLGGVSTDRYLRVRGTNGSELEPEPDPLGEDPWSDLWFYSNPIFLDVC